MPEYTCNQCHKEMKMKLTNDMFTIFVFICDNPECPNYSLLQIASQEMEGMEKNANK